MATEPSGSGTKEKEDIEEMMKRLGLTEDDLDDVVFEEEAPPLNEESTRWLAIARVHTETEYSQFWFYKNMRAAWDLAQDVKFRAVGDNLYILQFACLGDWEKVMEGGPWAFRNKCVIIEEYDGFTKPSTIELERIKVWIQIHDLPPGYKPLLSNLAGKVGEFICIEPDSTDHVGNFHRVRIRIDVRKPLKKATSLIRGGKREIFPVLFERIPHWCGLCGHLGHTYKEHGDGLHRTEDLTFSGLLADPGWRGRSRPLGGRGTGRGAIRGGRSWGRGFSSAPGQTEPAGKKPSLDEEMDEAELNRKRVAATEKTSEQVAPHPTDPNQKGSVGQLVNQFENPPSSGVVPPETVTTPPSPVPKRDTKRMKKGGPEDTEDDESAQSARGLP
jgi:hypothetical protein